MQYQTPQFIEVEDKIFGPLTTKQFFYIAGGVALIAILYVFFQLWVVILLGMPIGGLSLSLAFFKVNGIPFPKILSNFISHASQQKLYIWKPAESAPRIQAGKPAEKEPSITPKLTERKLQDLAWSLDVQQKIRERK